MKQKKKFVVQEFPNPSGAVVYRVYGRLNGERLRKNFDTRQEADAECQLLEIQAVQKETGVRVAATRLPWGENRTFETQFGRAFAEPFSAHVRAFRVVIAHAKMLAKYSFAWRRFIWVLGLSIEMIGLAGFN